MSYQSLTLGYAQLIQHWQWRIDIRTTLALFNSELYHNLPLGFYSYKNRSWCLTWSPPDFRNSEDRTNHIRISVIRTNPVAWPALQTHKFAEKSDIDNKIRCDLKNFAIVHLAAAMSCRSSIPRHHTPYQEFVFTVWPCLMSCLSLHVYYAR